MGTTVTKAADANQQALSTASRLQLDVLQEMNTRISDLLDKITKLHEELQADKELIESDIAARDAQIERMNVQIETMIKLHNEMRTYWEALQEEQ